jgi:O-antigen/teichoic acid export membrane protein
MGLKKLLAQSIIWRCFYFFSILLVNVFLSRYMKAAGSGNLYYLTLIFSFAQTVLSLSAESGIIYFGSGRIIERNKFINLIGCWSFVAGLLTVCLTYVYFLIDHSFTKSEFFTYCFYSFFYVCGQTLANYCLALYYTRDNYFLPNFLLALVNIIFVLIIPEKNYAASAQQVQHVIFLYFTTFFVAGLAVYISYIVNYKNEGSFSFPDKEHFIQFLKYVLAALTASVISFLVYKVDYVFVNYSPVCTDADLGNYIQVSKLGQMFLVVPQIIASVVFPQTATGNERMRINNAIIVIARLFSQIFLVAFIVVILFGDWFFIKIFGESFNKMKVPMLVIIPGIFALSVSSLLSAYFSGTGKIKLNIYAGVLGLVIMVSGDYFFVFRYGIVAAAAVSTASYFADLIYLLAQFYKDYSIHWLEFIKWKKSDYNFLFNLIKKQVDKYSV